MRFILAFVAMSLPASAFAFDSCDDLWFTRNLVFDRVGYCFSSPLGKTTFGNNGCTTREPGLDAQEQDVVAAVIARERELGCHVDTQRTVLHVDLIAMRKIVLDLPLATEFESACIGWRGSPFDLHNAAHKDSHVIGFLQDGDTLDFYHDPLRDWEFVTQMRDGGVVGVGWVNFEGKEDLCDQSAG